MRAVIFTILVALATVHAHTAAEWKSRAIYQILVDRFARTDGSTSGCNDFGNYCGGTFQGIINKLDYIQGMGFNAIWISPVVQNVAGGYHGYWAKNIYEISQEYGGEAQLRSLISACHNRGIWVMIDVVGNHMGGGVDISNLVPFNQASDYHDCSGCPSNCWINDFTNMYEVEHCKLAGLPDLNQDNSRVRSLLLDWVKELVGNYSFDGVRVDTVPEVKGSFWSDFTQAAGSFTIGEVFNGDINYVSPFQGPLSSVLSYPMYYSIRDAFAYGKSMTSLSDRFNAYHSGSFKDTSVLGTFVDNHDNVRFLNVQSDQTLYRAALTYVIMAEGIPIIYYGSEQAYAGGTDPGCREPLWTSGYNTNNALYQHIATLTKYRIKANLGNEPHNIVYADDQLYAFTRGPRTLVLLTNQRGTQVHRTLTNLPFSSGTKLTNIFWPSSDFITVQNGAVDVYLNFGESKVYYF